MSEEKKRKREIENTSNKKRKIDPLQCFKTPKEFCEDLIIADRKKLENKIDEMFEEMKKYNSLLDGYVEQIKKEFKSNYDKAVKDCKRSICIFESEKYTSSDLFNDIIAKLKYIDVIKDYKFSKNGYRIYVKI